MQIKLVVAISLIAILANSACTSEQANPDKNILGYQYYPLDIGDYRIYDVQEINFTLLEGGDTNNFQLKEVIHDYHQQKQGDTSYYLYRYSRDIDIREDWELDSVWTIRKDARRVVIAENNVPYIKLVFPLNEGLTWDGNGMNAEEEALYTIASLNTTFRKEEINFDSTLKVIEKNNMDTVIQERYSEAIYAPGVGLVYKELRYIDYCATTVECLGLGIIEGGRKYVQLLKEYGKKE